MEIERLIHYFLVDLYADGNLYAVGVEGNKEQAEKYFQSTCQEVIFSETKRYKVSNKNKMAHKAIPDGYIVSCHYYCDRNQSHARSRRLFNYDKRYHTCQY